MKKFYIVTVILLTTLIPCLAFATTKGITLTWTMNDTTGVTGYKLYYSDNENMENKTWHQECDSPTHTTSVKDPSSLDFSMSCNNFPIECQQTTHITISAFTSEKEVESDDVIFTIPIPTLTKVTMSTE